MELHDDDKWIFYSLYYYYYFKQERRIDMYIAEIEMEPLFQLGSTIRWALGDCCCSTKFSPNQVPLVGNAIRVTIFTQRCLCLGLVSLVGCCCAMHYYGWRISLRNIFCCLSIYKQQQESLVLFATMSRSIFSTNSNLDSKYEHLLIELETSDNSTVALVLRLIFLQCYLGSIYIFTFF